MAMKSGIGASKAGLTRMTGVKVGIAPIGVTVSRGVGVVVRVGVSVLVVVFVTVGLGIGVSVGGEKFSAEQACNMSITAMSRTSLRIQNLM